MYRRMVIKWPYIYIYIYIEGEKCIKKTCGGVWAENPMPFDSLNYKERNAVLFSSWFKRIYIFHMEGV
jgi:hypothetical protein